MLHTTNAQYLIFTAVISKKHAKMGATATVSCLIGHTIGYKNGQMNAQSKIS